MKKLSDFELIDLVALNRVLEYAEQVLWGIEDGYHYISDAHMAVRIRVSDRNMTALKVLVSRFQGTTPFEGLALRSVKVGKSNSIGTLPMDGIKKFMCEDAEIPADDTHIMYQTEYGGVLRALYAEDMPSKSYIFLDMALLECLNADAVVRVVKAERTSPVHFERGDEIAVVLPINMHTPAFMVHLN